MTNVAVITGASMGLGEEFARQLAARRIDVVLVARSREKLEALAAELSDRHGIRAFALACDLTEDDSAQQVFDFLTANGLHPTWLINNAGFGLIGPLEEMSPQRVREMITLNVTTLVALTQLLLPGLRLEQDSRIINVASTAAFQPIPYFNVYAATKVFVLHFSEALREELQGSNVRVLCLCPGPTPTQFHVNANIDGKFFDQGQSAEDVVRLGIHGSDKGRTVIVCQRVWLNFFMRFAPRIVIRKAAGYIGREMLRRSAKP